MKAKRYYIVFIVLIFILSIASILVHCTNAWSITIFKTTSLFTYFGVLIGFSLTIYTFGLSMVAEIKKEIENDVRFSTEIKASIYDKLISGFNEIKQDIWIIFISILIVIYFAIVKEIINPFGWDVESWKIPEIVNLTLFFTTTIAMYDIMTSLFRLAEVKLELLKSNKDS